MSLGPRLDLRQSQSLVMTPQLRQAIQLLQYSNVEAAQFIEEELLKNPLLSHPDATEFVAPAEAPEPAPAPVEAPDSAMFAASGLLPNAADAPLGLVTNGERWMLVHAPRGETSPSPSVIF